MELFYAFTSCQQNQKGRSSCSLPAEKSGAGAAFIGGNGASTGGTPATCAFGLTRSTRQARILLNQRPCHSRASISKDTFNSSPIWILNCCILSAPNTSKHILRGYWSCVSMTYSCTFHSLPFRETPPRGSRTAITLPDNSISCYFNLVTNLRLSQEVN